MPKWAEPDIYVYSEYKKDMSQIYWHNPKAKKVRHSYMYVNTPVLHFSNNNARIVDSDGNTEKHL